jgi:NYN domain
MKTFRAYLEVDTLKPHRRDALQSMGLTLLDCPHRGKKEVADKIMIGTGHLLLSRAVRNLPLHHLVDMILFAIDNPAPATVIVASHDRDYQYAISMLRLRQYNVIVLTKEEPHPSMVVHSTPSITWKEFKAQSRRLAALTPRSLSQLLHPPVHWPESRPPVQIPKGDITPEICEISGPSSSPSSCDLPLGPTSHVRNRSTQSAASPEPELLASSPIPNLPSTSARINAKPSTPKCQISLPSNSFRAANLPSKASIDTKPRRPFPTCNPFFENVKQSVFPAATLSPEDLASSDDDYSVIDDFADATDVDWNLILPATQTSETAATSAVALSAPYEASEYDFDPLPFGEADWAQVDRVEQSAIAGLPECKGTLFPVPCYLILMFICRRC